MIDPTIETMKAEAASVGHDERCEVRVQGSVLACHYVGMMNWKARYMWTYKGQMCSEADARLTLTLWRPKG